MKIDRKIAEIFKDKGLNKTLPYVDFRDVGPGREGRDKVLNAEIENGSLKLVMGIDMTDKFYKLTPEGRKALKG
jgi:hypothetical protein